MIRVPSQAFFRAAVTASLAAALPVASFAQQPTAGGRPFGIDDALNIRTSRIEDVSDDGRWVALTVRVRRDAMLVDHSRYGDPTYVAPALSELQLIDATTGQSRAIIPGKSQARGVTFTKDDKQLAFVLQSGEGGASTLNVYDLATAKVRQIPLKTTKQVASNSPLTWAPDGKSVLITLRPDGWAAAARAAFVNLDRGPITV